MKVTGIIAEYNPFHQGHAYHLARARELTGADRLFVVMGGNFMQRGEPAIVDKYARAEMALKNGADLVLELRSGDPYPDRAPRQLPAQQASQEDQRPGKGFRPVGDD